MKRVTGDSHMVHRLLKYTWQSVLQINNSGHPQEALGHRVLQGDVVGLDGISEYIVVQ